MLDNEPNSTCSLLHNGVVAVVVFLNGATEVSNLAKCLLYALLKNGCGLSIGEINNLDLPIIALLSTYDFSCSSSLKKIAIGR